MRNWYALSACLLLSFSIWLVMNLSRSTSGTQTVSILACSNIKGCSDVAVEPVDISARCSASGFRHIALGWSDRIVKVYFDPSDLIPEGDGVFYADIPALFRKASDIFGADVNVESFTQQGARFRFLPQTYKTVPVVPVSYFTFASQYTALDRMSLSADSVLVYGEPERLDNIDRIRTVPVTLRDLRRDARGSVELEIPPGVRLSESQLDYYLPVGRYIEMRSPARIEVRNVPSGTDFAVFPVSVTVTWRCSFPVRKDPVGPASFYIDYQDFANSLTGRCVVKASGIPDGVISWEADPPVCECIVKTALR